jgi:hypothetical protein
MIGYDIISHHDEAAHAVAFGAAGPQIGNIMDS